MSRNNTGNPIGSKAFPDFEDNVKNLDEAVNSQDPAWTDRFGVSRATLAGQEDRFDAFIESSGYQFVGDYAAGIELTEYNQLIRDSNGEFWRVSGQIDLPYTTTGNGVPESDALVSVGDAVLRQDLSNPGMGAAMVAYGGGTVADKLDNITSETANPNPNMFEMVASQVYTADSLLMRVRPSGLSGADRELAVCIPYSHKRGALYNIGREINDRLIRRLIVYSADHGGAETLPITGGDVEPYITNGDRTGLWHAEESRIPYTYDVGATVSHTFTGTGISFAFYRDDRGGVWGVSVDGVDMPDISTWAAEPGYPGEGFETAPGIVKVASGLPLGAHTVTLTFKGADPLHAPSSGDARGWVIQTSPTDSGSAQWRAYGTFRILNLIDDVTTTGAMSMNASNMEFAVLCRPADSPSVPNRWFPTHNGIHGVITILSSKITVDGTAIDLDSPGIYGDPGWQRVGVVQIVQTFTAQNPEQPSRPLISGSMLMSVTPKGLAISVVFDVLEDLYVAQGYSLMPSAFAADTILTGAGEFRQLSANDSAVHPLNDSTTGVMYSSSLNDFVVAWEVMNPMQSQRVGKPASVSPWTAVSDRESGRLKQYNFIAQNGVIPAGERIVMMGRERCVEIGNPELVFLPSV